MQTVPIELPDNLAVLLERVCMENHALKQEVLREIVIRYLEDVEDAADAVRVLAEHNTTTSLHEMRRELDLGH